MRITIEGGLTKGYRTISSDITAADIVIEDDETVSIEYSQIEVAVEEEPETLIKSVDSSVNVNAPEVMVEL